MISEGLNQPYHSTASFQLMSSKNITDGQMYDKRYDIKSYSSRHISLLDLILELWNIFWQICDIIIKLNCAM